MDLGVAGLRVTDSSSDVSDSSSDVSDSSSDVSDSSSDVSDSSSDGSVPSWWKDLPNDALGIFIASVAGEVETLKLLLNNSSNSSQLLLQVDGKGYTALHWALNSDTAKVLVESVEPNKLREFLWVTNEYHCTALDEAVRWNRADVVKYMCILTSADESLLDGHLLPGHVPLHVARSVHIARILVESVPSDKLTDLLLHTNSEQQTVLHAAVMNGHGEIVEYLCGLSTTQLSSADELLYMKDRWGRTALHLARTVEIARLLIDTAQDKLTYINITDNNGRTALHLAGTEIARLLIDTAQDKLTYINITNNNGRTALHEARTGEIACLLIDTAQDKFTYINITDDEGGTALHLARTGEIARLLIDTAQDKLTYINITDNEGNTTVMSMTELGCTDALDYILQYMSSEFGVSCIESALLKTNKKRQNIFHIACISPLIERLYELLEEYLDCVKVEDLFTADIYNNTPFTYLVARVSTRLFAQFILKFPLCQRRILLLWPNQMQTSCLTLSMQKQFRSEFYMQEVLCSRRLYHDLYLGVYNYNLSNNNFTRDHLLSPENYIQYDADLFKVMKYALNEYSLLDKPMISTQSEIPALTSSLQRYEQEQTVEMDENSVTAQSTLQICYFDADELALEDIQRQLYKLDVMDKHGEPKVIVVRCSTSDLVVRCSTSDLVRYLSPPAPDFIIITLVSVHSASDMFSNLQTKSFGDLEQLLGYLKRQDIVKYININSTMSRHCGSSSTEPADDHVLLSGASKGKALIVCNRTERKKWEIEHGHACCVMEQLGLQVKCLYDKSADDLLTTITEFSKSSGHGSLTALAIMSHGDLRDNICGDDGKGFCSVQQVVDALCQPDIQSVTKLVFLNFCRGPISSRTNRTNASWECTDLRDTAQMTLFSPIRANVRQDRLDSVRQSHPFPSVDVPVNCYICYSTLPDTMSSHLRSADQTNKMFDCLSEHLTNIYKCNTLYKRVESAHTLCSIPPSEQDLPAAVPGTSSQSTLQAASAASEFTTTWPAKRRRVAKDTPTPETERPRVELIPLLIDVTAIVREESRFTQYMNLCYAIDKDSKPLVVEILPANK